MGCYREGPGARRGETLSCTYRNAICGFVESFGNSKRNPSADVDGAQ